MDSRVASKIASVILGFAICGPIALSDDSSLIDSKIKSPEGNAILALEKLVAENRKLRDENERFRIVAANSTAEAEVFKRQITDLSQRMEALGASTASPSALEQKVLQSANAFQHSESSKNDLVTIVARLSKILEGISLKADAEEKLVIESEMKKIDQVLTGIATGRALDATEISSSDGTLLKGKVCAVKPELECVVINVGTKQGIKVGMPFRVKRGQQDIATLRVVDARQTFAGTVIQKKLSDKETVNLGDTITIDAQFQ